MPSQTNISIGLSAEEKQAIQNAAKEANMSVSEYVKRLFEQHVPGFHYESKLENRGGDKRSWQYQGVLGWGYVNDSNAPQEIEPE